MFPAPLTESTSSKITRHRDGFRSRHLKYVEDNRNALVMYWFYMKHLGNLALFFSLWKSIKRCSKAFCAREKRLVMPSCCVPCPHGPLRLLRALFISFHFPVSRSSGRMSGTSRPEAWLRHLSAFSRSAYFPQHFQTILSTFVVWPQSRFAT